MRNLNFAKLKNNSNPIEMLINKALADGYIYGFISIGHFACLPTRIVESILTPESKLKGNERLNFLKNPDFLKQFPALPFISIECDENPFPPIIEARIKAFCLQVERRRKGDSLIKS